MVIILRYFVNWSDGVKKLTAILLFSGCVLANPAQQEQQINMMLAMMEKMGELERVSQCVALPPNRVKAIFRQTFADCGLGDMMSDEPDPAHEACMQQSMVMHSGIAAEQWQACGNDGDDGRADDPLLAELEALSARIGEREPTAAEQRQMEQIIERMQQRGVAQMQQMVDGMIAGSQGSEASITLPLFPQAQLLINLPAQAAIEIAEQSYPTLPGASFVTTATPAQVLHYYRQQLPAFQLHRPSLKAKTDVALMQSVPAGFDYSRDIGRAFSIPHIYIQPASESDQQRLAGAKTLFFIYYQPAG
jgi:hypothetical protein